MPFQKRKRNPKSATNRNEKKRISNRDNISKSKNTYKVVAIGL